MARPPLGLAPPTTVKLTVDQQKRLDAVRESTGIAVAYLIRQGVDLVLEKHERPPARRRRAS